MVVDKQHSMQTKKEKLVSFFFKFIYYFIFYKSLKKNKLNFNTSPFFSKNSVFIGKTVTIFGLEWSICLFKQVILIIFANAFIFDTVSYVNLHFYVNKSDV